MISGALAVVQPVDYDNVADAIAALGLEMLIEECKEQKERWISMHEVLRKNNLAKWREDFINALKNCTL